MHAYPIAILLLLAGSGLGYVYQGYGPVVGTSNGYSTNAKLSLAESTESSQSQESSNKGYSTVSSGYPAYGIYGAPAYDQNSRSTSSSKSSRSISKEDSTTTYNSGVVAPGFYPPQVGSVSGYSTSSKLNAAESSENTQSREFTNKGYSKYGAGYPAYAESVPDQRYKSDSSSKASRSLNKEDSTTAFNSAVVPSGYHAPAVGSAYSTKSKINAAESSENTQTQESSNKGYSKYGAGYPPYGAYGAPAYADSAYDQRSKSDLSSSSYVAVVAPSVYPEVVGSGSGYASSSKLNAAENKENSKSLENSNKGYYKVTSGTPSYSVYGAPTYAESGNEKKTKADSSSKDSGTLNKEDSTTAFNSAVVPSGYHVPAVGGASGFSTSSKVNAAENSESKQFQESSNKGYSKYGAGYPTYGAYGAPAYADSTYDHRSKSDISSSPYVAVVAPSVYPELVGSSSGYASSSKLNAAENKENSKSQEVSNKGYSRVASGYPGYGVYGAPAYAESGNQKKRKVDSSSKGSGTLKKEDSTTTYKSGVVAPDVYAPVVSSGSGYSSSSKLNAAENKENSKSQEVSNKGYSRVASGYPGYGVYGAPAYAESGNQKKTNTDSSSGCTKHSKHSESEKKKKSKKHKHSAAEKKKKSQKHKRCESERKKVKHSTAEKKHKLKSHEIYYKKHSRVPSGYLGYGVYAECGNGKNTKATDFSSVGSSSGCTKKSKHNGVEKKKKSHNSKHSEAEKKKSKHEEKKHKSKTHKSSNKAAPGYPAYGVYGAPAYAESAKDQSYKSASSSKASCAHGKEDSSTTYNSGVVAPGFHPRRVGSVSGYSSGSKLNAAQSSGNKQSQESSNKGHSKYGAGYPAYGVYGAPAYAESAYDQSLKTDSSSKASRSLNKEDSTTAINSGIVAPGFYTPAVGLGSAYSTRSKLNAAESSENTQSQESSNKGYSKYSAGYPAYGVYGAPAYAESAYDQNSRSTQRLAVP